MVDAVLPKTKFTFGFHELTFIDCEGKQKVLVTLEVRATELPGNRVNRMPQFHEPVLVIRQPQRQSSVLRNRKGRI